MIASAELPFFCEMIWSLTGLICKLTRVTNTQKNLEIIPNWSSQMKWT